MHLLYFLPFQIILRNYKVQHVILVLHGHCQCVVCVVSGQQGLLWEFCHYMQSLHSRSIHAYLPPYPQLYNYGELMKSHEYL